MGYSRRRIPDDQIVTHFWTKVNKAGPVPQHRPDLGPCWVWTASCKENGYGQFYINRRPVYAHRFSYLIAHGVIPDGLRVLHRCDNPPCVRPSHLFVGTARDNMDDALAKGRIPMGERRAQARLADAQVAAIRALVAIRGGVKRLEKRLIARAVGVSEHYLDDILSTRRRRAG